MPRKSIFLTQEHIRTYVTHLKEQERSSATIRKYTHDLNELLAFLNGGELTKAALIDWKHQLVETYSTATVNSMLAAINSYLAFIERRDLCVKPLKLQKALFLKEEKELTREEYARLVKAAERQENERLSLVIQTICATGIRVSELRYITVEAVHTGRAEISNKGKRRVIFLPDKLRRILKKYVQKQKKTAGAVFTTRTGKPLDRSNIWRDMKALCESANVDPQKVFPHNLRHLFARTYYTLERDLSRLADILGHSSVSTARIYTAESGAVHARQMRSISTIWIRSLATMFLPAP